MASDPHKRREPWPRGARMVRNTVLGHLEQALELGQELVKEEFTNIQTVEVNVAYMMMHLAQAKLVLGLTKMEQGAEE